MKSLYIDICACVSKFLHVFFPNSKLFQATFVHFINFLSIQFLKLSGPWPKVADLLMTYNFLIFR